MHTHPGTEVPLRLLAYVVTSFVSVQVELTQEQINWDFQHTVSFWTAIFFIIGTVLTQHKQQLLNPACRVNTLHRGLDRTGLSLTTRSS